MARVIVIDPASGDKVDVFRDLFGKAGRARPQH
jgi:hypothetical protein